MSLQYVGDIDIFTRCDPEDFRPDPPPVPDPKCLPGTRRRPLRMWYLMSTSERLAETRLAAALDSVGELALEAGVVVPDPEDALMDRGIANIHDYRKRKFDCFMAWYAGREGVPGAVPGREVPTLQVEPSSSFLSLSLF